MNIGSHELAFASESRSRAPVAGELGDAKARQILDLDGDPVQITCRACQLLRLTQALRTAPTAMQVVAQLTGSRRALTATTTLTSVVSHVARQLAASRAYRSSSADCDA